MFKTNQDENFQELQKLLALKRLEMPSPEYFNGVLNEFHQRQRAALLQPRYTFVSRLFSRLEALRDALQPQPALRYALASVAAIALLTVGLVWTGYNPSSPALAQQTESPVAANQFAFTQGLESHRQSRVDQQIDSTSLEPVNLDKQTVLPHYVMAQAPTSYDIAMAF